MTEKENTQNLILTALAAGILFTLMLGVSLFNGGITAQDFEVYAAPISYARDLQAAGGLLQILLTFDYLFVFAYTAAFLFLAQDRLTANQPRLLVLAGLTGLLATTVLDLQENADLLSMLALVQGGGTLTEAMLRDRMVWSQLKFFSSYLGFFLIAFTLPKNTLLEKMLRQSLWFVYPLVGTLAYTTPTSWLSLVRYLFMASGFFLLAWNYSRKSSS